MTESSTIKIGAMIFATDQSIKITKLAPELEARGFESLWLPEKTHLPVSRRTPWPGGELPEWYKRAADPLVALATAVGLTSKLRFGTGVCLLPLHDPVILAKAVATLDWVSEGRFEFGIGYGWNAEEFATHGVSLDQAPDIMREKIALMKSLWTNEIGAFQGQHVNLEPSWSWPKPIQKPCPPIHIGARATRAVFADIAEYADGWLPIEGYGNILENIPKLHAAFTEADRPASEAKISVYSSAGAPEMIEQYARAGVERVIVTLPATGEYDAMSELDRLSDLLVDFLS